MGANSSTEITHNYATLPRVGKKLTPCLEAFSRDEILTHCTSDSLWIIIDNLVYDVTKFRRQHPGGASILEQFGGNDGTEAFVRYGHSRLAKNIMKKYLIGKVEQSNLMESLSRSYNQFQIGGGFGKSS